MPAKPSTLPHPGKAAFEVVHDVAFLESGREETLDIYLPENNSAPRPAFVWIHGGGWKGGTKRDQREVEVGSLLAGDGFVVISIDYKLGKDAHSPTWPQPLLDCKNAVRFLRANAKLYNVNPRQIAVMGGSAGGHLALMTAFTNGMAELEPTAPYPGISNEVAAVGNFYGVTNLLTWRETLEDGTPTQHLRDYDMQHVLGESRVTGEALWRMASPITHIRPGLPPVFNTHGKRDTVVDYLQALELAQALEGAGVWHETILLEEAGHTYALRTWQGNELEIDLHPPVTRFLRKAFAIHDGE